jgi:aspartyl/glutamyl-tRNA(Asn/Gln) amidotransferase C subunit
MSSEHMNVRHIADLARIDLSEEECETFQGQLDSIIGYIETLKNEPNKKL